MIPRKIVVWLSAAVLLMLAIPAYAQPKAKVARIEFLAPGPVPSSFVELFRQGLRELGYVEGTNIVIEWRSAEGKEEQLPVLAGELVRLKVDVLVTAGPSITRAAREATATIPIVFTQDPDPVGNGFVGSLARPGGNVTGLSYSSEAISGKRLELLGEVVKGLKKIAILWNPRNPVTIWVVRLGDDLYVRSYRGTGGSWFRGTQVLHEGRIRAAGVEKDVTFVEETDPGTNDRIDAAYRTKYRRYAAQYVGPMVAPEARATTLKLAPRPRSRATGSD